MNLAFKLKIFILSFFLIISFNSLALSKVSVDSCNRTVTFDSPPQRAISNDVNLTEMMLVLGLSDKMVGYTGISGWKTLDEEMRLGVKQLPELSPKYPTKEVLVGADADFFFAGWNYGMKVGGEVTPETLKPFGINVYELTESCIHIMTKKKVSMDDMYNDLLNLGLIFQIENRAKKLVDAYRSDLKKFTQKLESIPTKKVFVYDSGEDTPFTAGRYAMPTALIEAAGGINIMDDFQKSWGTVTWEEVIDRNPAFANIDAVKNDRFVTLEYVEATPGPRNIKAIKKLAKAFRQ